MLSKSESYILRTVFGYAYGAVSIAGHPLTLHHTQGRALAAARALHNEGLVTLNPHTELTGCVSVTRAHQKE